MSIPIDETMSEEMAFTGDNNSEDVFKFDPVKTETGTDSASTEDKQITVSESDEEEEKRVPYSRFKSVKNELEQRDSVISDLEQRLSDLETNRIESTPIEDLDVPREWVELYGDSDASKRAYKIQLSREAQLQEQAIEKALLRFKEQAGQEEKQLETNENIIEENLQDLEESLGKKITPKMEEDILSIVDEFSPTGADGKYLSLFPFDKAYEIYALRNQQKGLKTIQARNQVADLTGNSSEGEIETSDSNFKRGWDNWREAL